MDLFERFIFGGASSSPPTSLLRWDDNLGTEDRHCTYNVCNYEIESYATDPDNNITTHVIQISTDLGVTWNTFISQLNQSTFIDQIINPGTKWYRAIVTDSDGNTVTSNILKMSKVAPAAGDIVLEFGGVMYQEWDTTQPGLPSPINMPISSSTSWLFKNIHPTDYMEMYGVNPPTNNNAMSVFKYGDPNTSPSILTSPQGGETLQPNMGSQLPGAANFTGHSGLYVISISFVAGQWSGGNIPGAVQWLINLGASNTCKKYKALNYPPVGSWPNDPPPVDIEIVNCSNSIVIVTVPGGTWQPIGSPNPGNENDYVRVPGEIEFCAISINDPNGTIIQPIAGTCP
jgi:hypothetical protein